MTDKLKPCPFCGEIPKISNSSIDYSACSFGVTYTVACPECKISFKGHSEIIVKNGEPTVLQNGYLDCIEKWNRRADNDK